MKAPKKEGPTAQETALAQQSKSQWDDYVTRYKPAEAALIKKAQLTAGERAQVKGEVSADTEAAFKGLARTTKVAGEAAGADISSGKTKLSLAADAAEKGTAKGVGQALAIAGAQVDSDTQKVRIAGIGRGIAADATANLSQGAQRATKLALAASQARFEQKQSLMEAGLTIAGAATRKYQLAQEGKKKKQFSDDVAKGVAAGGIEEQSISRYLRGIGPADDVYDNLNVLDTRGWS